MSHLHRYAHPSRTRVVVFFVLTALDSLLSALVGIPPIRWCARRFVEVAREMYLTEKYGPPSECTQVEPLVIDGEIVDEETGR